ncbi:TonB-dependent receptor [Marinimicrobium sp. ARAG 43.8]|uniref:TonB-dependent receptor n=1 Tax=Marinimicrobium sp. ARAG 43.8 TaxID=3418719 RepID=UPI003CE877A8
MTSPKMHFHKKIIPAVVAACAVGGMSAQALAQQNDGMLLEEVVVTGVRSAQETAVNVKRDADSIVDAISAEDIGKLPDVTITDSLQRISGVQVRRTAGEGGSLNIRGLAQVQTTLNGESYLGANSITSVQPNFSDIPSQLFSGTTVIKSQTAENHPGGISGVVDLQTYRPLDSGFDQGWTLSGAVQGTRGTETEKNDPSLNFLANWRNDRMGFMLSFAHQKSNLANTYSGMNGDGGWTGFANESYTGGNYGWVSEDTQLGGMGDRINGEGIDVNGNGTVGDSFWAYQGHAAFNRASERERNGVNAAFQVDLGNGFELVTEAFYTKMEDYDRQMGVAFTDKWNRWDWAYPSVSTPKGVNVSGGELHTVQEFTGNGMRLKSYSDVAATEAESQNFNIELNYDNGGPFIGSARFVHGSAEQEQLNSYMDIDAANGSQWGVECQLYPAGTAGEQGDCADGRLQTNPNGYQGFPVLTVNYEGSNPHWSGWDNNANLDRDGQAQAGIPARSLQSYLDDVNSYSVGAFASENNFLREGDLNVARFDGSYELNVGVLDSIDFGIRYSERSVDNFEFDLMSPSNGCDVKWKATDVVLNGGDIEGACTAGEGGEFYTAGNPTPLSSLDPVLVTDYGSATGIPAVWTVNPESMDDVESYHNGLYPGTYRAINPGRSYGVDLDELSTYAKANFSYGIMSGNLGLRVVETDLTVDQYQVGNPQPYGAANESLGTRQIERSYSDVLPSLNVRFDLTDDLTLRAAFAETMAPLDLAQWGSGLSPNYAIDGEPGSPTYQQFIVTGGNSDGNPDLDPWRARNYDLSLEYYLGPASALSAGLFYIDVDSFIESGSVMMELPDQDGVVRRSVSVSTSTQGEGGELKGVELSAKLAFGDFWYDSVLENFGTDVNYTYSPSESGNLDLNGGDLPFQDNSEHVFNLVGWYEAGPFQARVAYNYRSERVAGYNQTWGNGALWQEATGYVDLSASYDINDAVSVFFNASNITEEKEQYYLEYEDQFAWQYEYEARYTLGVRATF